MTLLSRLSLRIGCKVRRLHPILPLRTSSCSRFVAQRSPIGLKYQRARPFTTSPPQMHGRPQRKPFDEKAFWTDVGLILLAGGLIYGASSYVRNVTANNSPASTVSVETSSSYSLPSTIFSFFTNLFTYPSSVRTPLRQAVYYHYYSTEPQAVELAESNYKKAIEECIRAGMKQHDRKVVGIMLNLGALFDESGDKYINQAREWFVRVFKILMQSSKGENDEAQFWASKIGIEAVLKISGTAVKLAELSERLAAIQRSGFPNEAESWYGVAVQVLLTRPESKPTLFNSIVDGTFTVDSTSGETADSVIFPPVDLPPTAVNQLGPLLENFAEFYQRYGLSFQAITLYLKTLQAMTSTEHCHNGVIMNNIAQNFFKIAELERGKKAGKDDVYVEESRKWMEKALSLVERRGSQENECGDCECVVLNNLGQLCEFEGNMEKAKQYYSNAVSQGRRYELVECRREAQQNLARVNGTSS